MTIRFPASRSSASSALWLGTALVALGALLVVLVWLGRSPISWSVRAVGASTTLLSLVPGLTYLTSRPERRRPVPFLPIVGFLYGIYFGVPFLLGPLASPRGSVLDSSGGLLRPAVLALAGWAVLLEGYFLCRRSFSIPPWDLSRMAGEGTLETAGLSLLVLGSAVRMAGYLTAVPAMLSGLTRVLGLLAWLGAALLVAAWVRGRLGAWSKLVASSGILWLSVLALSSGLVAAPGRLWLTLLLAAWVARGRRLAARWWLAGALLAVVLVLLRGAALQYREEAWYGAHMGPVQGAETFATLVTHRVMEQGPVSALSSSGATVGRRVSLAGVLADVVQRTPDDVPYWGGRTYVSLIGSFVPRFLWPGKPVKNLGQRFGHRYGYLDPSDQHTSFNFPFLVEFYANFGALGVLVGMTLVGAILGALDDALNYRRQGLLGSVLGLGLLLPLMTNIGSDFSLIFGGLFLNGLALYAVMYGVTKRRRAGAAAPLVTRGHSPMSGLWPDSRSRPR